MKGDEAIHQRDEGCAVGEILRVEGCNLRGRNMRARVKNDSRESDGEDARESRRDAHLAMISQGCLTSGISGERSESAACRG